MKYSIKRISLSVLVMTLILLLLLSFSVGATAGINSGDYEIGKDDSATAVPPANDVIPGTPYNPWIGPSVGGSDVDVEVSQRGCASALSSMVVFPLVLSTVAAAFAVRKRSNRR